MSDDDLKHLRDDLASVAAVAPSLGRIIGLIKVVVGVGVASIGTFAVGILWVSEKANAIDATQAEVLQIKADRVRAEAAWSEWRRVKDDLDVKVVTILENQQANMQAIQRNHERLQDQINRADSRVGR